MMMMYRHPTLNISASALTWRAAGFETYSNTDQVGRGPYGFDELLILGLAAVPTGDGQVVIAWAIAERQRRSEERARVDAQRAEADAMRQLAAAISATAEDDVLQRLLGRLTDRTRHAVRSQFGR
jgi:hypothetical protein